MTRSVHTYVLQADEVASSPPHTVPPLSPAPVWSGTFRDQKSFAGGVVSLVQALFRNSDDADAGHLIIVRSHGLRQTGAATRGLVDTPAFEAGLTLQLPPGLPTNTVVLLQVCWGAYTAFERFLGAPAIRPFAIGPLVPLFCDHANDHIRRVRGLIASSGDLASKLAPWVLAESKRMIERLGRPATWHGLMLFERGDGTVPARADVQHAISDEVYIVEASIVAHVRDARLPGKTHVVFVSDDGRTWISCPWWCDPKHQGKYKLWIQEASPFDRSMPPSHPRMCLVYDARAVQGDVARGPERPEHCRDVPDGEHDVPNQPNQVLIFPPDPAIGRNLEAPCQFCGWGAVQNVRSSRAETGTLTVEHRVSCIRSTACTWKLTASADVSDAG